MGPNRNYDTQPNPAGVHTNRQGLGSLVTLHGLCASPCGPCTALVQLSRVRIPGGEDTWMPQGSPAYGSDPQHWRQGKLPSGTGAIPRNSFDILIGKTVVNTLKSEASEAWMVDYRRALSDHWSVIFGYANEGDPVLLRRDGFTAQAWLGGSPGWGRLYLGAGMGPHFARIATLEDGTADRVDFRRIDLRVSMGAGWRLGPEWMVRANWHRTYSSYDRDTALFMVGLGYLW